MPTFGKVLQEVRDKAGMSQLDLARRAGIGQSTVSQYEKGEREPKWFAVVAICDALGLPLDTFKHVMPPVEKSRKERQEEGAAEGE